MPRLPCIVCGTVTDVGPRTTSVICYEPCQRLYPEALRLRQTPRAFRVIQKTRSESQIEIPAFRALWAEAPGGEEFHVTVQEP
jgi:hypothetical protein